MQADVIIIGAGAAGLMAAKELSEGGKKVIVLEARSRVGGRIHTITDDLFDHPIEGGAEFIHGDLPLTHQFLKKAGLRTYGASGDLWQSRNGKLHLQEEFIEDEEALMQQLEQLEEDCTVAEFLQKHFAEPRYEALRSTLKNYVEGYYAGDLHKASTLALRDELQGGDGADERIEGGYGKLVHYLQQQCVQQGCQFYFSTPVTSVHWQRGSVNINSNSSTSFSAARLLVTVPVGVLQAVPNAPNYISFQPAIEAYTAAAKSLGFGGVIKVLLQFKTPFWRESFGMQKMAFLFSEQSIPTWWTQHPQQSNLLTGWCAGPRAYAFKNLNDTELFQKAVASLAGCFSLPTDEVGQQVTAWKVFNWAADAYTGGGYSYLTVESKAAIAQLSTPVEDTLFFAGEGLHNSTEIGTVEAALQSGQKAAQQVLQSFGNQ